MNALVDCECGLCSLSLSLSLFLSLPLPPISPSLSRAQDRLEQVLSKVPKEQHTCVDVPGEGVMDIKMRVFVTNSEDAKAVNDYIRIHEKQVSSIAL